MVVASFIHTVQNGQRQPMNALNDRMAIILDTSQSRCRFVKHAQVQNKGACKQYSVSHIAWSDEHRSSKVAGLSICIAAL